VLVEGALVFALIFAPLLLGVTVYGFNFVRLLQVTQINRDAGHMFARGVDLSGTPSGLINQSIITQMAPTLKDSSKNGTGVLILSQVRKVASQASCKCTNHDLVVFIQQNTIGNAALHASAFGSTQGAVMNTDGTGTVKDPYNDLKAVATGVENVLVMQPGDRAYIAETYFLSNDLSIPGFPSPASVTARAIF
jgi:hypothetical protein